MSNKERLDKVQESGKELLKAKPEMSELVSPKIKDLSKKIVPKRAESLQHDVQQLRTGWKKWRLFLLKSL